MDLTDFKKYRVLYLFVIFLLSVAVIIPEASQYHEVYTFLAIRAPKNLENLAPDSPAVKKWFLEQTQIITSDLILGKVRTKIDKTKLRGIIFVQHMGSSNTIKISIFTKEDSKELKRIVSEISNLYIDELDRPRREASTAAEEKLKKTTAIYVSITDENSKIENNIAAIEKRSRGYLAEIKELESSPMQLALVKKSIAAVEKELSFLLSELSNLRLVYTDSWPEIVDLNKWIGDLESQKKEIASNLPEAQRLEEKKKRLLANIEKDKHDIALLNNKLMTNGIRLAEVGQSLRLLEVNALELSDAAIEKKLSNRILTEPAEISRRVIIMFGGRIIVSVIAGMMVLILLAPALKNLYLRLYSNIEYSKK